jgi:signal peptidase I
MSDPVPAVAVAKRTPAKSSKRMVGCIVAIVVGSGLLILFAVFGLAVFMRVAGAEAFEIQGPSMLPLLANGDRILVSKSAYGLFLPFADEQTASWGEPMRGDVVILKSPHDGIDIAKRIIGIGGDTVEIREDVVVVNGTPLPTRVLGPAEGADGPLECVEETIDGRTHHIVHDPTSPPHSHPRLVIPAGHVYVLGDHRDRSNDSRFIGPIPVERLKGQYIDHYVRVPDRVTCPTN